VKTSEVLRGAAKYLREHGWQQHSLGADGRARCAVGALYSAAGDEYTTGAFTARAKRCVEDGIGDPGLGGALPAWNDAQGRTIDDVIAAFERAAEAAEREERGQ
jgi:hypothetical protein